MGKHQVLIFLTGFFLACAVGHYFDTKLQTGNHCLNIALGFFALAALAIFLVALFLSL